MNPDEGQGSRIVCLFQLLEKNKDQISTEIAKQEELSKKLQTANIDYEGKYFKVSKGAKIRNRYNQVPYLTQDTNGKVTNSQ